MFAIVRTGGKQYRVAAGDKIVVEKLAGEAGDTITLSDVLLAGDGGELKSTDGLTVSAEIIAQAKADKVTVFKKKRRHNYRRKRGHRQQHTILKIVAIGGKKAEKAEEGRRRAAAERPRRPPRSRPRRPSRRRPRPGQGRRRGRRQGQGRGAEEGRRDQGRRRRPSAPAKKASTKKPAAGKAE